MDHIEEIRLINESLNGKLESYSFLVKSHQSNVISCLASRLDSKHEAEDLAQEAFIIAYNKLASFDQEKPFGPWVRSIALNLLRNYWRKHKPTLIGDSAELDALVNANIDNHETSESNLITALKSCLAKLPEESRKLINARFVNELSLKEIQEKFSISHSTLTMRIFRIKEKLQKCVIKYSS